MTGQIPSIGVVASWVLRAPSIGWMQANCTYGARLGLYWRQTRIEDPGSCGGTD